MGVPVSYNLRNLVERKGTTLMTALGIGLTVAVVVTSAALVTGLNRVFAGSGDPHKLLVLRKGTNAELTSAVTADAYQTIRQMRGIATDRAGAPLVSPEGLTVVNLPSVEAPEGMKVTVRGMLPVGLGMRPLEIVAGKAFEPGMRQIIVGEQIARRYPGARMGQRVRFGRGEWEVVGVFRVGESAANSEIWVDLNQLRSDFEQSGGSSSLLIQTSGDAAVQDLTKAIAADQRLSAQAMTEKKYYEEMTSSGQVLAGLGFAVAVIMSIGSAFAATNTMYAAVARRTREIGTLRALGFGRWAILRSFMLESVCLALLGGLLGVLIALPINGMTTGVGSFATFSEIAFRFRVGPGAVALGLGFATVIGALGGFLPAWSASKKSIVAAMRDI